MIDVAVHDKEIPMKSTGKRMKFLIRSVVALLAIFLAMPAFAGEPTEYVKLKTKEVTSILSQKESKVRTEKLRKVLETTIDFRELAKRSLGEHWTVRTPEEQEEFLSLLQELLRANYETKLGGNTLGKDYDIKYADEATRKDRAIVKTMIAHKEESKPVDYKLIKKEAWTIYDVVIDDISLEETYRESYVEIIEDEGWDSLIKRMKERVEEVKAK